MDGVFCGRRSDENVVKGCPDVFLQDTDAACGISLRIPIYEQCPLLGGRQACGQINRSGCFSYSAFLVGDCDNSTHDDRSEELSLMYKNGRPLVRTARNVSREKTL